MATKGVRPGLFFRAMASLALALARVPDYQGRLILLVDADCGSACGDLVTSLKDNGRALIVGNPTTGSTGQPVVRRFDNGMGFRVGARRVAFPDGTPFEGFGIVPDEVIRPTPEDLRTGHASARLVLGPGVRPGKLGPESALRLRAGLVLKVAEELLRGTDVVNHVPPDEFGEDRLADPLLER